MLCYFFDYINLHTSHDVPWNTFQSARRRHKDMSFVCACVWGSKYRPRWALKTLRARVCIRVRRNSGIGCIYFWLLICVCGDGNVEADTQHTYTHKWFYGGMFLWQITGGAATAQRRAISFNFYIFSLWVYDFFFFPYIHRKQIPLLKDIRFIFFL